MQPQNKILVIHPDDRSTDCLKLIYKDRTDMDVINDFRRISEIDLFEIISKYDKIIMLGHGTPNGLFDIQKGGYLINRNFVPVLKEKETISIWCHSDQFFRAHNMKGFHTGMIISETSEALWVLGRSVFNDEEMLDNMNEFSSIVGECIDLEPEAMRRYIRDIYNFDDEITQNNRGNILVL